MTRVRAIAEAEKIIARIAAEHGGLPGKIILADYDSEETLRFLAPDKGWPLAFHRSVMNVLRERLARKKVAVEVRVLTRPEYLAWLAEAGLRNSPRARATFAAGATPAMAGEERQREKS